MRARHQLQYLTPGSVDVRAENSVVLVTRPNHGTRSSVSLFGSSLLPRCSPVGEEAGGAGAERPQSRLTAVGGRAGRESAEVNSDA